MFYDKTGWMMEWDNELRYYAPIRSYMAAFTKAIHTTSRHIRLMGISMQEAVRRMNEAFKKLEQHGR